MRYQFGEHSLDDRGLVLSGPDGPVHVEPQVFALLHHLLLHRDRVVPKEELLDAIWGDRFVSESALTSRIKAARRAVGDDGQAQAVIKTAHGRGYQLVADVRTDDQRSRPGPPRLRTALIGRADDVDRIVDRIRTADLVTITGSGGIGKTTVALAVAQRLEPEHADGVVFVDLASVAPGEDVTRPVAEAARVEGAASESLERLAQHLADRPLLVVLDNCEHVLPQAAALVDRMLALGGPVHLLATSREPLGVAGEHVWPLGSLHEGPLLFVERARAAEPRIEWDPDDPAVLDLCRRLDDVPLALELAAGQLRRFDKEELLDRLADRPSLLTGRATGEVPRHATMETAIEWGYRLLDDAEQRLLRQLSAFPAPFDLAAVEGSAPPLSGASVVEVLGQLVDKSLVVRLPGTRRYRLLETIRAFARQDLDDHGETDAAFERHRVHLRDRVRSTSRLDRWMSASLGAAYRAQLDDARQAFRLSLQQGEVADALEIAIGSSFLWRNCIGCTEGQAWVELLLAADLSAHDQLWVQLLAADVGQGRGDAPQLFRAAAAALELSARVDDAAAASLATHYAALPYLTDLAEASARLTTAVEHARRADDQRLACLAEVFLLVAHLAAGEYDPARELVARLHRDASADGYDRYLLHWAAWMLGLAERDAGAARRWIDRQQAYLDRTDIIENWLTSISTALCEVVDGGDHMARIEATLALAGREGYDAAGDCVLVLAYAELFAGRFEVAAELVGTALHARINSTAHFVLHQVVLDRTLREQLAPEVLAAAMARGRTRTAGEALAGSVSR